MPISARHRLQLPGAAPGRAPRHPVLRSMPRPLRTAHLAVLHTGQAQPQGPNDDQRSGVRPGHGSDDARPQHPAARPRRADQIVKGGTDRRRKEVHLTPVGAERMSVARGQWAEAQTRFEAVFGDRRAAELRGLLGAVVASDLGTVPPRTRRPPMTRRTSRLNCRFRLRLASVRKPPAAPRLRSETSQVFTWAFRRKPRSGGWRDRRGTAKTRAQVQLMLRQVRRFGRGGERRGVGGKTHYAWIVAAVTFLSLLASAGIARDAGGAGAAAREGIRLGPDDHLAGAVDQSAAVRPVRPVRRRDHGPLRRAPGDAQRAGHPGGGREPEHVHAVRLAARPVVGRGGRPGLGRHGAGPRRNGRRALVRAAARAGDRACSPRAPPPASWCSCRCRPRSSRSSAGGRRCWLVAGVAILVAVLVVVFMRDDPQQIGLQAYGAEDETVSPAPPPATGGAVGQPVQAGASRRWSRAAASRLLAAGGQLCHLRRDDGRPDQRAPDSGVGRARHDRSDRREHAGGDGRLRPDRHDGVGLVIRPHRPAQTAGLVLHAARAGAAVSASRVPARRAGTGRVRGLLRPGLGGDRSADGQAGQRALRQGAGRAGLRLDLCRPSARRVRRGVSARASSTPGWATTWWPSWSRAGSACSPACWSSAFAAQRRGYQSSRCVRCWLPE